MVTVKMAEDDIRGAFHRQQNSLPDFHTGRHLAGMRKKAMTPVSQGKTRIYKKAPFAGSNQAGHTANTQGLRAKDFNKHDFSRPGQ